MKSISLNEAKLEEYVQNNLKLKNHLNILKICSDFLVSEKIMCSIQNGSSFESLSKNKLFKYEYGLNLVHFNGEVVQKRNKRPGSGSRKSYRKSFPLMSPKTEPVSNLK